MKTKKTGQEQKFAHHLSMAADAYRATVRQICQSNIIASYRVSLDRYSDRRETQSRPRSQPSPRPSKTDVLEHALD